MRFLPRQCHPVTGEPYQTLREIKRDLRAQDQRHRNADKAVRSADRILSRAARRLRA